MVLDRLGRPFVHRSGSGNVGSSYAVRLQDYVDADLSGCRGGADVCEKIKRAQDELARAAGSGDASLYPRVWVETSSCDAPSGWERGRESSFTVATFNTLAKGLSSGPIPTPFAKANSKSDAVYGGFTDVKRPEVALDFDVRKWRLLHVLLGGGVSDERGGAQISYGDDISSTSKPAYDILALEEVDEYNSFFRPALVGSGGYEGVFQPKTHSPCVPLGFYSDGVALLWNRAKFQTIARPACMRNDAGKEVPWIEQNSFDGTVDFSTCKNLMRGGIEAGTSTSRQNQGYIIVPLRIRNTGKCVIVAATHLKAKKGPDLSQIRHRQALELRCRAECMAEILTEHGWKDVSILITGDFNSEPEDDSVKCILSGEECSSHKSWRFRSVYPINEPSREDSMFTTWKTRKDGTVRRIIDYIFHASGNVQDGKGLQCTHYLSVPEDGEVEEGRLPGYRYPSDHVLIAANFRY